MEVSCPIFEQASQNPHHLALITDERTWTYAQLDGAIHSLTRFLKKTGIKEKDHIPFIAKSHLSTILLLFALFRMGAVACPLSFRIPQEKLPQLFKDLRAAHIFEPETLPLQSEPSSPSTICLYTPATLLLTSGSSGFPKIASHTYANHYYNALGATAAYHLESSSRWLLSLPLFHVSGIGILFRCFLQGAAAILSELPVLEAIGKHQITHLSQVPTQLYRLLKEPDLSFTSSLQCLVLGGAPLPKDLIQRAHAKDLPILTTYGMTEMSSTITLSEKKACDYAGKILPYRELKIEKDQEIWVRGKTRFEGYWNPAVQSVDKLTEEQWFPTQDLGKLTESGELEIIGRKDRQFISGGENIQPEEIEKALCNVPGIVQASVLPVDDPEFGKRPVAFIHDETASHTLQTIRKALSETIPSFMYPIAILNYPNELELKPSSALLKAHLKEWSLKNQG